MKSIAWAGLLGMAVSSAAWGGGEGASAARRSDDRIEVGVEQVFAPAKGYDDNDNVQVVVHGTLPNACYTLADAGVQKDADAKTITVHQYAVRRADGVCAQGADLPLHMQMAVPFQNEVAVGQLSAADYAVKFLTRGDQWAKRTLSIEPARAATIDNLSYAAVDGLTAPSVTTPAEELQVEIHGLLNSSCTRLAENVQVLKEEDVVVILPQIEVREGVLCAQMIRPFRRVLNLGKLDSGEYLLHVRSMNGRSVNRVAAVARQ